MRRWKLNKEQKQAKDTHYWASRQLMEKERAIRTPLHRRGEAPKSLLRSYGTEV